MKTTATVHGTTYNITATLLGMVLVNGRCRGRVNKVGVNGVYRATVCGKMGISAKRERAVRYAVELAAYGDKL